MPIDLIFSPDRVNNPFEMARRELVKAIASMDVPAPYGSWPEPEDHEAVSDHIRHASGFFDHWLKAIGSEVASNSTVRTNRDLFDGMFVSAVDGWATFELERCAEALREERVA